MCLMINHWPEEDYRMGCINAVAVQVFICHMLEEDALNQVKHKLAYCQAMQELCPYTVHKIKVSLQRTNVIFICQIPYSLNPAGGNLSTCDCVHHTQYLPNPCSCAPCVQPLLSRHTGWFLLMCHVAFSQNASLNASQVML